LIAAHRIEQSLTAKKKREVFSTSDGLQDDIERAGLWVGKFFCFSGLLLHISVAQTELARLIIAPNVKLSLYIFV